MRLAFWDFVSYKTPEVEHDPGKGHHITVSVPSRARCGLWIHKASMGHQDPVVVLGGAPVPLSAPQPSLRLCGNADREPGPALVDADAVLGRGRIGPVQQHLAVVQGLHSAPILGEVFLVVGQNGLLDAADALLLLGGQGPELGLGPRAGPPSQDLLGPLLPEVVAGYRDHVDRPFLSA